MAWPTKDRLYESKLSREMLKGSFSPRKARWFDEVVEMLDLECQKVGFSCCGDGWRTCQWRIKTASMSVTMQHDGLTGK